MDSIVAAELSCPMGEVFLAPKESVKLQVAQSAKSSNPHRYVLPGSNTIADAIRLLKQSVRALSLLSGGFLTWGGKHRSGLNGSNCL